MGVDHKAWMAKAVVAATGVIAESFSGYPRGKYYISKIHKVDFKILETVDVITLYMDFDVTVKYNSDEIKTYAERVYIGRIDPEEFADWYDYAEDSNREYIDTHLFDGISSTYTAMMKL